MKIYVEMPQGKVKDTFITPAVKARLESMGEVIWNETDCHLTPEALKEAIKDADVCVCGWGVEMFTGEMLKDSNLKVIAYTGGSVAPYIAPEVYDTDTVVLSGNKMFAESVAEGTLAYMLTALRRIPDYLAQTQELGWVEESKGNQGLLDRSVGLVGFGAIPRYLTPMLQAFRCDITAYDPFVDDGVFEALGVKRAKTLNEVFTEKDIVSIHLPMTRATYHTVGAEQFDCMKDGALLVNTARGGVIDEKNMAAFLQTGRCRAILDVYETEPLEADSGLRHLENVYLMPHMGGPTVDRRWRITMALLDDVERHMAGKPMTHVISKAYGLSMTNDNLVNYTK